MKTLNRILIVDDDQAWRQIISEQFEELECEVHVADHLAAAEELILAYKYDLAVLDLSLSSNDHKNIDGLVLLQHIRAADPECKCVMMTGFATVDIAVKAIVEFGAIHFFRKEAFVIADFMSTISSNFSPSKISNASLGLTGEEMQSGKNNSPLIQNALVIEDDPDWRDIHSELLDSIGLAQTHCSSYGQAMGQLGRSTFSIVLLDLNLRLGEKYTPAVGLELESIRLMEKIRATKTPIIIISGLSSPDLIDKIYRDQNIFAYFEKQSYDRELLKNTILKAIQEAEIKSAENDLTNRESEVMQLVTEGMTNKEIAIRLFITPNTVKRHLKSIFAKMDVHTRSGAVAKAKSK